MPKGNDNKIDGMDALGALLGLGLVGAMLEGNGEGAVPPFIKEMMNSKVSSNMQKPEALSAEGADNAKKMYDAYVSVGFTEAQAFELLKTAMTTGSK